MTKLEARLACPVCLGATLEKVRVTESDLTLDFCARCGGVWFDAGEIHQLRASDPQQLWQRIARREGVFAMMCHSCNTPLERDQQICGNCQWYVTLDCPQCRDMMESGAHAGISVDACKTCKGVWLDHHELETLWRAEFTAALQRRNLTAREGGAAVLDVLAFDPFGAYYLAHLAGHAVAGGVDVAPAVLDAAGEAASGLFETIVEIIGGIFG